MKQALARSLAAPAVNLLPGLRGDTLLFSMRQVSNLAAYCMQYEFEDVFVDIAGADRVEPTRIGLIEWERKLHKALYLATASAALAMRMTPKFGGLRLEKRYELFVAVFNDPFEVFALQAIPNWRERCRKAVCVISEAWESDLPEALLKSLAPFDRIYLASNPVASVARISGRPCSYLPPSVDALALCPFPHPPPRSIDVLGIGRRSPATHAALLRRARERGLFYYYDTIRTTSVADSALQITFSVIDAAEHRAKLASMLKRSRYYIANRARANQTGLAQMDELSGRFFEGAAAGAIMIGDAPESGHYPTLFDWPDAVVKIPFDAPAIDAVIAELDADADRCVRIRRSNMVQALARHDSAHRWRIVFRDADLPIPPGLLAREQLLRLRADEVQRGPIAP